MNNNPLDPREVAFCYFNDFSFVETNRERMTDTPERMAARLGELYAALSHMRPGSDTAKTQLGMIAELEKRITDNEPH